MSEFVLNVRISTKLEDPRPALLWLLQEISIDIELGKWQRSLEHDNYKCDWQVTREP